MVLRRQPQVDRETWHPWQQRGHQRAPRSMRTALLTLASLSSESGKAVGFGHHMQRNMLANGSTISVMVRVAKHGRMAESTRVSLKVASLKASVGWNGTWQTA